MRSHSPNSRYSHRFDEPNYTIQFENGTGKPVWADSRPSSTSIFKKLALVVLALFLLGIVTMFSVDSKVNIENRIPKKELNVEDYLRKTYGMGLPAWGIPQKNTFPFILIADLDKDRSKVTKNGKVKWRSVLQTGEIHYDSNAGKMEVKWGHSKEIYGKIAESGRGMELSELVVYNGRIYTCDDRTGMVFELNVDTAELIPRYILMEGDGNNDKGFKCEWMTVKDGVLFVGSFGKEYTGNDGAILNNNNLWIKTIDVEGRVLHYDWTPNYEKLRQITGTSYPGYMVHEAIMWSPVMRKWIILPRRVSTDPYTSDVDEKKGSNLMMIADENFEEVVTMRVGSISPLRGFSSFKFLPGSADSIIVAIKSEEQEEIDSQNSYITAFDVWQNILLEETPIPGELKFEGLEFLVLPPLIPSQQ